jgi:hypothetical protein
MAARLLTLPELSLLIVLLRDKPQAESFLALLPTAQVEEVEDGGIGSLRFVSSKPGRQLGEAMAELWYNDEDGVLVLVRLYLDADGDLYELDSWKTDASPLRRIPSF